MATAASTLIRRTRRLVRDYPDLDTLGASLTSVATSVTVVENPANGLFTPRQIIQVGDEAMLIKTASSVAATITVTRAVRGTTATTHANAATVLVNPAFLDLEILDALNEGLDATFPFIYQPVLDTSLTAANSTTYEFTIPDMADNTDYPIPYISKVEWKDAGETDFYEVRSWEIRRGTTPKLKFPRPPADDTNIRLSGFGPFSRLTASSDSLDVLFPPNAEGLLVWFAGNYLLASGEAGRVRVDRGMPDQRENANRTGSSMQAANSLLQRFQLRLGDAAMPPLPRHAKPTFMGNR